MTENKLAPIDLKSNEEEFSEERSALSLTQNVLLSLLKNGGGNTTIVSIYNLEMAADLHLLTQALSELTNRHDMLRTSLSEKDTKFFNLCHPLESLNIAISRHDQIDCSTVCNESLSHAERIRALIEHARKLIFCLQSPPLFHLFAYTAMHGSTILILAIDHVISDGYSMHIFFRDLFHIYNSLCNSNTDALPQLKTTFSSYIYRNQSQTKLDKNSARMLERLSAVSVGRLPHKESFQQDKIVCGSVKYSIDKTLSLEILKFNDSQKLMSPFPLFMAATAALLASYGQERFSFKTIFSGRVLPEIQDIIGPFAVVPTPIFDMKNYRTVKDLINHCKAEFISGSLNPVPHSQTDSFFYSSVGPLILSYEDKLEINNVYYGDLKIESRDKGSYIFPDVNIDRLPMIIRIVFIEHTFQLYSQFKSNLYPAALVSEHLKDLCRLTLDMSRNPTGPIPQLRNLNQFDRSFIVKK